MEDKYCPVLNATFNEVLRYTGASTSGRVVLAPTEIGGKTLYPGARILVPYRPSHFSDEAFGPNLLQFDPQRFIKDKELTRNPAYRPFGGGSQYCSGRVLARREVVGFLAFVLDNFDIDLKTTGNEESPKLGRQKFPRLNIHQPNIGIISIKPRKKDYPRVRIGSIDD